MLITGMEMVYEKSREYHLGLTWTLNELLWVRANVHEVKLIIGDEYCECMPETGCRYLPGDDELPPAETRYVPPIVTVKTPYSTIKEELHARIAAKGGNISEYEKEQMLYGLLGEFAFWDYCKFNNIPCTGVNLTRPDPDPGYDFIIEDKVKVDIKCTGYDYGHLAFSHKDKFKADYAFLVIPANKYCFTGNYQFEEYPVMAIHWFVSREEFQKYAVEHPSRTGRHWFGMKSPVVTKDISKQCKKYCAGNRPINKMPIIRPSADWEEYFLQDDGYIRVDQYLRDISKKERNIAKVDREYWDTWDWRYVEDEFYDRNDPDDLEDLETFIMLREKDNYNRLTFEDLLLIERAYQDDMWIDGYETQPWVER